MTGDGHYIIVARIDELERPYTPAEAALCSHCGAGVWLGHAVLADVPDGIPICRRCVGPMLTREDVIVVTPEVRREAAQAARDRRN